MVLENSSNEGSESFSDDAPASDSDPYTTSSDADDAPTLRVDTSRFPQPLRIWGIFGISDEVRDKSIAMRLQLMAQLLGRIPTQDEANAMGYWTAKQIAVTSYGTPLGVAFGTWRAYSTRSSYTFPFYKPNLETFNPNVWPSIRMTLLSGTMAKQMWFISRLTAYGIVGNIVGTVLFSSYGMSVASVGELSDPRLKTWIEAVKARAQLQRGQILNPPKGPGAATNPKQETISPSWGDTDDNASPTSGTYTDSYSNYAGQGASEKNQTSERDTLARSSPSEQDFARQPRQTPSSRAGRRTISPDSTPAEQESGGFEMDFGDASPTSDRETETQPSGGSAWDRIRQQAALGKSSRTVRAGSQNRQQETAQQQRPSLPYDEAASADSYSYSTTEQDRQFARDQAQKEFDARVEKERRGGEFSSGNGDQKRW